MYIYDDDILLIVIVPLVSRDYPFADYIEIIESSKSDGQ